MCLAIKLYYKPSSKICCLTRVNSLTHVSSPFALSFSVVVCPVCFSFQFIEMNISSGWIVFLVCLCLLGSDIVEHMEKRESISPIQSIQIHRLYRESKFFFVAWPLTYSAAMRGLRIDSQWQWQRHFECNSRASRSSANLPNTMCISPL